MELRFLRAAMLAASVFLAGCDAASSPQPASSPVTVLEGKTMGTSWRVSMVNVEKPRAEELQKIQAQRCRRSTDVHLEKRLGPDAF